MNGVVRISITIVVAIIGAVWIGAGMATDQIFTSAMVMVGVAVGICLALGRRIWLLIPLLGALNMTLMLPGRFSSLQIAQILFIAFTILLIFSRNINFRFKFRELEFWALVILLCVGQVYLRNPVGLSFFGSGNVGGRPYFVFALSLVSAVLLSSIRVDAKELKMALKLTILGGVLNFILGFVGWLMPSIGQWYGAGHVESGYDNRQVDTGRASRVPFIIRFGPNLALWISSFINPLKACFSLKWAPLVLVAFAAAGISGYRNVIVSVGLTFLVGIFYRGGIRSVIMSLMMGVCALLMIAIVNLVHPLPANVQRSLSWLPGTWEERHVLDAEGSSDWRFEMWEEALLTDNWIDNKILGDGLGFTAAELAMQQELDARGWGSSSSGLDQQRETMLINGDYHSGPVSAIRTIGYVGLFFMIVAMLRLVVHAHRQIIRCKGTEWFPVALIFCIPIIWMPIFFLFVFGGFQKDAVAIMLAIGMVRLLQNNIPLPAYRRGIDNSNYQPAAVSESEENPDSVIHGERTPI